MGTVTVRNIDEDVKRALRLRAARHGVSMEQEIRDILRETVTSGEKPRPRTGAEFFHEVRRLVDKHGAYEIELPARTGKADQPPRF